MVIKKFKKPYIIAEIGSSHLGNMELAKKTISQAKKGGADCVKFQLFDENNLVNKNIKLFHLHVDYDETNNVLKYNRKLKQGSGEKFYGLNVAKYLINDNNFMQIANEIKTEIFKQHPVIGNKTSKYNSNLWINECQICSYAPIFIYFQVY